MDSPFVSSTESDRWADDLVAYFSALGGSARLTPDLYDYVEKNPRRPLIPTWKGTLRRTIYEHSSDAITVWPKGPMKRDLFRVMGELGDGSWGLRQYVTPQTSDTDLDRFSEDVLPDLLPERQLVIRELIKRDQRLAKDLKKTKGYTCEVCGKKSTWTTAEGIPYVEAHHLIPLGSNGSDDEHNLIVVCADCHRMLHYGTDGEHRTRELLEARKYL